MIITSNHGVPITIDDCGLPPHVSGKIYIDRKGYAVIYSQAARKLVKLHRQVIGANEGETVDHINGDKLDNRRSNLRICSMAENQRNRLVHGFQVANKNGNIRYRARVTIDGKRISLGGYATKEEAIAAYARYYDCIKSDYKPRIRPINQTVGD